MAADPYELAYLEARRALEDQNAAVNELRSRAGVLIAAAAITTSFFGNAAIADARLGAAGWIAVAAFAVLSGCVLAVLWPSDWIVRLDADEYLRTYVEPADGVPLALPAIHRDLALHTASHAHKEGKRLRWSVRTFRSATVLLAVEVLAWVLALVTQGS